MSNKDKPTNNNMLEIMSLIGPSVVLRSENQEHYDRLFAHYCACFTPTDILEWTQLKRLVNSVWFMFRYARHQTLSVERSFRDGLEFQAQRLKSQNARSAALASSLAQTIGQKPAEVGQLMHLENKVVDAAADVDEFLSRIPTEIEHNRAMEKSLAFQAQLEILIESVTKRFNDTLEFFEHYREGLGSRLRETTKQLIEGEFAGVDETRLKPTAAPSLVPPDEGATPLVTVQENNNELDPQKDKELQPT